MMKRIAAIVCLIFIAMPSLAENLSQQALQNRAIERRAVEAVIWGMPAVNYDLMLQEMLTTTKAGQHEIVYWGRALDWMNQTLTPNPDTIYFMTFFDTHDGPIVIDVPAAEEGSLNGNIVTAWQMPLEDVGLLGVDKGAGGKFVVLPPGFLGTVPKGFTPLQSDTFGGYALVRSNLASHSSDDVDKSVAYGKKVKVYPLSKADNPSQTVFTDAQDVLFDSTIRFDSTFFEHLNRVVQNEPWLARDMAMIDTLKSLGIEKGKPFKPDAETRSLLDAGAVEAKAFLDAKYEAGWEPFYEGTQWRPAGVPALAKAVSNGYADTSLYPTDVRGMIYTLGYIGIKRLGAGQFYLLAPKDKDGENLDGARNYKLTVPADAPVDQYWSVTVYDRQTHGLVRNMTRASRASNNAEVRKNADGSVDLYFGPTAPAGKEANWVPTDPLREFELMLRAYGPKKEFFEKAWVLPDVEKVAVQ
ncbi:DUF1254 domain-containing protein [Rhizobium sp. WYCCWR 11152]|uniref:DUF1254 domain-containing protein n=1 Tax=Rhizobium sp. WYCCWR 11152 TaxID=2692316 RepID=UPI001491E0FD|nr:DUF1254 domain-containing protein [Rhizobium sp. WYCCWR 11152]NNU69741.1 DUF1254 domain-containing protein [Rhizobium sp. WYCCWR 11152]